MSVIDFVRQSIHGIHVPNSFRFYQLAAQFDDSDLIEEEEEYTEKKEEEEKEEEEEEDIVASESSIETTIITPVIKEKRKFPSGYVRKPRTANKRYKPTPLEESVYVDDEEEIVEKKSSSRYKIPIDLTGIGQWLVSTLTGFPNEIVADIFTCDIEHVTMFAVAIFFQKIRNDEICMLRTEFFRQRNEKKYHFSAAYDRFFIEWCLSTDVHRYGRIWIISVQESIVRIRKGCIPPMIGRESATKQVPVDPMRCILEPRRLHAYGFLSLDTTESFMPRTKYYNYKSQMYIPCVIVHAYAERVPAICNMVTITTHLVQTGSPFHCDKYGQLISVSPVYEHETANITRTSSGEYIRRYNVFAICWQNEEWSPYSRSFYETLGGLSYDEYKGKYPDIFSRPK